MVYPSKNFYKSWVTQKMLNNFPEFFHARTCPVSVANQMINYEGILLQETIQDLFEERENQFLTSANASLLDHLYVAEIPESFEFEEILDANGAYEFVPPAVYATINNVEREIEQAENNNIETIYYKALPTRIEYDNKMILWNYIIPRTQIKDLPSTEIGSMPVEGQVHIILEDNTIWYEEFRDTNYFSKIILKGKTIKGIIVEEVIPLRFNGYHKSFNRWQEITDIEVLHLSEDAYITISALPLNIESVFDSINLSVPIEGKGRKAFIKLEQESFGTILVSESYLEYDEEYIRRGHDDKRKDYQIELLDENEENVVLNGFLLKPNSPYIYAIDNQNFYVYNRLLPFPDISSMIDESADCRIELTIEDHDWIYVRGETANITTRIIDLYSIPSSFRWGITLPNGSYYRVGQDGSYWDSDTVTGWIENEYFSENAWREQKLPVEITETGEYILELEARYVNEDTEEVITRTTKLLIYCPAIEPEVQLPLPSSLYNCQGLALDDNYTLWLYNGTSIFRTNLLHDYFMIDYDRKKIWLREQYNEVKVVK